MSKSCFHCKLPIDENQAVITAEIEGKQEEFCCLGCKSVCEAIYQSGMSGFYQRTLDDTTLAPPPEISKDLQIYDLEEIQQDYVQINGNIRTIQLLVEGIHCAACVWLIEKSLAHIDGVIKAQVNLSAKKLQLVWDNEQLKLSEVMARLGQIGYNAVPFDPEIAEGKLQRQNRSMLYRLGFAAFAAMNLMWISIALYTGADQGDYKNFFYWLGLGLSTPTLLYSGYPFFKSAWTGLLNRHLTMDLPIAIGAFSTWSYSVYVTVFQVEGAHVYYDTVVNFIFVILTGRFLEAISKRKAVSSTQRLLDLQPKVAWLLENGEARQVLVKSIKKGEKVLVKPGERIAVDGVIVKGKSEIDESMLTGESFPISKTVGDPVSAGTTNKEGVLEIQVERVLADTALGKIINLVDEAQSSKAPIQCTADRIVPWFVSTTLVLALITFLYWLHVDFEKALMAATSVLIITCPCAFGLATPMAIAVATGVGARIGVLFKHGAVLEMLAAIRHYVFDKTGTLTKGQIAIIDIISEINPSFLSQREVGKLDVAEKQLLQQAAELEKMSEHPVARAIVNYVKQQKWQLDGHVSVDEIKVISGQGIKARVNNRIMAIGNQALLQAMKLKSDLFAMDKKLTSSHVYIYDEKAGIMLLEVEDQLRENAKEVVQNLINKGIDITLLSGDKKPVAESIAAQLGIANVIAEVHPEEKDEVIKTLQQQGKQVAMVGDGVNDAPALVRADVGIAMESGTDVSLDSADVILLNSDLEKIPLAMDLSQRTLLTIKQNIGLSIVYNIIMVPLAMAAWVTPLVAAIAMPISSLLVIGNAARIRWFYKKVQ